MGRTKAGIVVISDEIAIQEAFQGVRSQMCVTVISRVMLTNTDWRTALDNAMINACVLLLELPRMATATGTRHDRKILDRCVAYVDRAMQRGSSTLCAIVGPRASPSWAMGGINRIVCTDGMHRSFHQWCALGAQDGDRRPVAACTQLVTSQVLHDTPCKCAQGTQHTPAARLMGVRHMDDSGSTLRSSNIRLWATHLVSSIFSLALPPVAETGADSKVRGRVTFFPTDSEEKQKLDAKARKDAGLEAKVVKKKSKVHERHFDDCGDDLSGLGPDKVLLTGFEGDSSDDDEDDDDYLFQRNMAMSVFSFIEFAGPMIRKRGQYCHEFNTMEALDIYFQCY